MVGAASQEVVGQAGEQVAALASPRHAASPVRSAAMARPRRVGRVVAMPVAR